MSSTTDRIMGMANQAVGTVRKEAGRLTGSTKLKVEGELQKQKGKVQEVVGKAKGAMKAFIDKG